MSNIGFQKESNIEDVVKEITGKNLELLSMKIESTKEICYLGKDSISELQAILSTDEIKIIENPLTNSEKVTILNIKAGVMA